MKAWITRFLAQLVADVPPEEVASWPSKVIEAREIIAGTGDGEILAAEAQVTGETITALAQKVLVRATAFAQVIGYCAGLRRATNDAIEAATTPAQIQSALQAAKNSAAALATSVGLQPIA
jgi:hypothetical protein